jgi:hypothetical protein
MGDRDRGEGSVAKSELVRRARDRGGAIDIWVWDTAADFNAFLDDARVIESFEFDLTL